MNFKQPGRAHAYWQKLMKSAHVKISQGAYEIYRAMPWAKGDCWRRNDKVRHELKKPK